ncbi:MAG: CDP-alcohol phosphatidyltransferase family protein [Pirellulaceae bacterium]
MSDLVNGPDEAAVVAESSLAAPTDTKADCYSAGERRWMENGQHVRAVVLAPLLRLLIRLRVTPDMITLLAGALGVAFLPLVLVGQPLAACMLLWSHVLLDGLDGPLARQLEIDSPRGSFTDTFTDQLVVAVVSIAWMTCAPSGVNIVAGTIYVFLYTLVVAMAMVRNALFAPYSWLVRPRFFVYLAVTLDVLLATRLTLIALCIFNVLLAIKAVSGFLALRRKLPGGRTPGHS